jgi:hypothetical protein
MLIGPTSATCSQEPDNREVAYVMINCESGCEELVIEQLKSIQDVGEVQGIHGNYDIIVKLETESLEILREIITFKIRKIQKIRTTTTLMCGRDADSLNHQTEMDSENDTIFKFIKGLDTRKHILLLYDDTDQARKVEFEFIKKGLEKGEHCIYATEEDPGYIILKMINDGINVKDFVRENLHVYQMPNPFNDPDGPIEGCKNNLKMILADSKPPFRIVGRLVSDVSTIEGISVEMELERYAHDGFDNYGGSVMCIYDIAKIETSRRKEWLASLIENHHVLISVSKSQKSGVFSIC